MSDKYVAETYTTRDFYGRTGRATANHCVRNTETGHVVQNAASREEAERLAARLNTASRKIGGLGMPKIYRSRG